ncbi:hypothetical protein [Roseateles sp. P5_E7]
MKPKNKLPPWLRPKSPPKTMQVHVGWYTEAEWATVKAAALDSERFEETYAEWVQMAEQALVELQATGVSAERSYTPLMSNVDMASLCQEAARVPLQIQM